MTKDGADILLHRWGFWSRYNLGLGYYSVSPIYRMMKEGDGAGHSATTAEIAMPRDIEIVEAIVNRFSNGIKRAIKYRYIASMADREGAKRCRCSQETFNQKINQAIDYVVFEYDNFED